MRLLPLFVALPCALLILTLGLGSASAATILPGTYALSDHGDGQLGLHYGLRADALGKVFSVEIGSASVTLFWDGGTTANISGSLNENTAGGNGGVGPTWTVDYTLSGVSAVGTQGFEATGGLGTLTDPSLNVTVLTGKTNDSGVAFSFLADGHRLGSNDETPVGRGWLLPSGSTNDWLVRATAIPEPGTGLLLTMGLVGLAYRRRA